MKRYRVAQVGLGSRGRTHVEGFLHNAERFDLVALCDLDEERLLRGVADYGVSAAYTDADKMLAETGLILPKTGKGNKHAFYLYVVRHPRRNRIIASLKEEGIMVHISYPCPVHLMPAYRRLGYKEGDFPVAERAAQEIFSLPMYPSLTSKEQKMVLQALIEILSDIE